MPLWHPISISGYHIREAGSTAAQELAFTLADGFTYVEWGIERGLDVDDFAPRLSFFFNSHLDFFEEIGKYRARSRIWARELRERYGAKSPRSWLMRFHTQTAGVSLTAQQPEVNLVRTAIEALAAVLGEPSRCTTNSFDEALALPTEHAVRLALRTQQVIAHETGIVNSIDPLGGSYYVEHMTNELERQAYDYFDRIDKLGGVVEAIKENFFQREIAEASFRYQTEVERNQRVIVGVNRYQLEGEPELEILKIDPALETRQIERVKALKGRRDSARSKPRWSAVKEDAAHEGRNLMYPIVDAARVYVTMGEMCDALREVLGRLARDAGLLAPARPTGGSLAWHARSEWSWPSPASTGTTARQDRRAGAPRRRHGGHLHRPAPNPEQIVETAIQEDADAVGISILSGAHMTLVPRILEGLREQGAEDVLVVVGRHGSRPTTPAEPAGAGRRRRVHAGRSHLRDRRLPERKGDSLSVGIHHDGFVATVVIDRQEALNAFDVGRSRPRMRARDSPPSGRSASRDSSAGSGG